MTREDTAGKDPTATVSSVSWAERAADRSPRVQRAKTRSLQQARLIVDAARRLIVAKGEFTTQELVKEAGVALQTFYRHFASKDQLLLAVIEDLVTERAVEAEQEARDLPDPVARLRYHITSPLHRLGGAGDDGAGARYITAEHFRLHQLFPDELSEASRSFSDLVLRELEAARAAGLLAPTDPERDAWLITDLVRSVFHFYAFATADRRPEDIADHLWSFCLRGVGGSLNGEAATRRPRKPRPR